MMRGLHRYLNALFLGFIVTFIIYLLWVLDQSELWRGVAIAVASGAVVLGVYIYLDKRFGHEPELYDRDGNLIDRNGKILRARSEL